ncbi:ABC transporter substrate-binding protein [Paraburkholderia nodosa]|uniref:ABC transporter substrate-binding protein n=1 Tax=Paraburkholderia nodosa TaxID=392320 RepID=UPI000841CEB5|nr:ABC transporter substrate-binding protein [Paraburkholderia nodosa]
MTTLTRRRFLIGTGLAAGAGFTGLAAAPASAVPTSVPAPQRREIVRVLAEGIGNSLDPHGDGVSRESLGLFTNIYDRLVSFDRRLLDSASARKHDAWRYDYDHLKGELAESFQSTQDGRSLTFHLRRDATFHDGRPVTADDVKWSLDRAVSLPASKRQLATGSLTDPAQFVVVNPHTLRIDLPHADRYALPNLALTFASVLNATEVKSHAETADPWGTNWLRSHPAGGGAYRLAAWQSQQQVAYERFDGWRSGDLPFVRRAIVQAVPSASNRLAALQRGDADIVLQLPPREFASLEGKAGVAALSIPVTNTFRFVAFNTRLAPFDSVKVRQAIAYALPYESLFDGVNHGKGAPLFGAAAGTAPSAAWPQRYPYATNVERARALLKEAGHPDGFQTTLSYNATDAAIAEPAALLIQDALKAIGVQVALDKSSGAQWGELQTDKRLGFFIDSSSAWFNAPDYYYRIFFEGDWRWNFGSFDSPALVRLTDAARWESDTSRYDQLMRDAAKLVTEQVPLIPLWQPAFDVATRDDLRGFTYYIHGQVDFRTLSRA